VSAGASDKPLIFLVAGEASGDALGGRLMQALTELSGGGLRFDGVGGAAMQAAGLVSRFPLEELSLMGLAEVLPHLPRLARRLGELEQAIRQHRPAALVTIDAPSFGLRLQRRLGGLGVPRIHYVAPQVWAWRQGRAKKLARSLEHLLALLPFEPPFFARYGLDCRYVGHPVIESGAGQGDGAAFRATHAIGTAKLLAVLPGSRRGEIMRHSAVFDATIRLLQARYPDLRVVLPTVRWPVPPLIIESAAEKYAAFAAADAALAASGTVALELGLSDTPMVIAYRFNPVTAAIGRRLVKTPHVSLVNLLSERRLVPEMIQEKCRPDLLAAEIAALLDGPAAAAQRAGFAELRRLMGTHGDLPSRRAARAVLEIIQAK
jgi:lipid-A-disaccharide synthase